MIDRALLERLRDRFPLDWYGDHGLPHWQRVHDNGLRLAELTGADPVVVALFAVLHDAARIAEGSDPGHGRRAVGLIDELAPGLTELQRHQLAHAIAGHSDGTVSDDATIGTCWDADRLDLPRVGTTVRESLLSTSAARGLIAWSTNRARTWSVGGRVRRVGPLTATLYGIKHVGADMAALCVPTSNRQSRAPAFTWPTSGEAIDPTGFGLHAWYLSAPELELLRTVPMRTADQSGRHDSVLIMRDPARRWLVVRGDEARVDTSHPHVLIAPRCEVLFCGDRDAAIDHLFALERETPGLLPVRDPLATVRRQVEKALNPIADLGRCR